MAATDPGWAEGHRRTSSWRRRWYPKSRVGKLLLLLILLLIGVLIWIGVKQKETVGTSPLAKAPAPPASASAAPASNINPPATTAVAGKTMSPAPVTVASQPKVSTSTPQQAKQKEKKEAKQVAVTRPVVKAPKATVAAKAAAPLAVTPPQGKSFLWTKVGGDPCNPKVGCTLAWALEQSKWPRDVQSALMMKVKGESPSDYTMQAGWNGWMTWGQYERKFRSNTLAAWPSGHKEPADLWSVTNGSTSYHLVRVAKCKNWGGFITSGPAPMQPAQPASPGKMPLGVIPTVACPD